MAEPTPFALSRRFSQLIGRKVTFVQLTAETVTKIKQLYGIYTVLPHNTSIIVKADLPLLGSFAGALVGFPDCVVREHLRVTPIEEILRDAIYEVFNIASAAITSLGMPGPAELFQCFNRRLPGWSVHCDCPVRPA